MKNKKLTLLNKGNLNIKIQDKTLLLNIEILEGDAYDYAYFEQASNKSEPISLYAKQIIADLLISYKLKPNTIFVESLQALHQYPAFGALNRIEYINHSIKRTPITVEENMAFKQVGG